MPFCDELNTSVSHQLVLLWGLSIPCRFGFECLAWEKHAEVSVKIWFGFRKIESVGEKGLRVWKNSLGSWENLSLILKNVTLILGKTATDFGKICHRLWENLPPTVGISATDFGKICHRLWEARFFEKSMNRLRCWDKVAPLLGKTGSIWGGNWFGFWIGLEQSSSLTVLNAKHVWVWIFEVSGLGVTKNKSSGGKLEG